MTRSMNCKPEIHDLLSQWYQCTGLYCYIAFWCLHTTLATQMACLASSNIRRRKVHKKLSVVIITKTPLTTKMKLWRVNWCWHVIKIYVPIGGRESHLMNICHCNSICHPHLNMTLVRASFNFRAVVLHFNFPLKLEFCAPDSNNSFLMKTT